MFLFKMCLHWKLTSKLWLFERSFQGKESFRAFLLLQPVKNSYFLFLFSQTSFISQNLIELQNQSRNQKEWCITNRPPSLKGMTFNFQWYFIQKVACRMPNFQKYFLLRYLISNEEDTGLPTKNETSKTNVRNLHWLVSFINNYLFLIH